jgi:hypothetical protein
MNDIYISNYIIVKCNGCGCIVPKKKSEMVVDNPRGKIFIKSNKLKLSNGYFVRLPTGYL